MIGYFSLINIYQANGKITLIDNKTYINGIDVFIYFAEDVVKPKIESFVTQGKTNQITFYTKNRCDTTLWFLNKPFPRKYKVDKYTREIKYTNDNRLNGVPMFDEMILLDFINKYNLGIFNKNKTYEIK